MTASTNFANVNNNGNANNNNASNVNGVRPDFDDADKTLIEKASIKPKGKAVLVLKKAKYKRRNARLLVSVCSTRSDTSELLYGT